MALTVVIAPDSFKGSLSAQGVAEAIASGWREVRARDELLLLPQADGGEGTIDAVESALPESVRRSAGRVTGPDGRAVQGEWLELPGGVAVAELAQMSGLPLMERLDPRGATTRGLGEVIHAALLSGATSLVVALGGSASTDGGAGALAALGLVLVDASGVPLADGGSGLTRLDRVNRNALVAAPAGGTTLLTDVTAPLLGPAGAAAVFGPQKGADAATVRELDAALSNFSAVLGGDAAAPGTGAAGGAAFGFSAAWGATIEPGSRYVAKLTGLPVAIGRADVLITGEGRYDRQSLGGKVVGHALALAGELGVRSGVIAGQVALPTDGWSASLVDLAGSLAAAKNDPVPWLREAGRRAAHSLG